MKYTVVIEKAEGNYSAYVPDLPGCVAVGDTATECEASMKDTIEFHIQGLQRHGIEIPEPTSVCTEIDVSE